MHKTPFEQVLETALYSVGIELGKPIYRQELLFGKQADDALLPELTGINARLFVSPSDEGIVDPGSYVVRRRCAQLENALLNYDIFLKSEPELETATEHTIDALIKRAVETKGYLSEAISILAPRECENPAEKQLISTLRASKSLMFDLNLDQDGYTWFSNETSDDEESPTGKYNPREMASIVLANAKRFFK